ncbi:MAG: PEP-CTERM sorting domain-containing protein, partial [Rhizonema sp. NSF051]|nr:PEP-CTERM sorting domain-containing protein [Rhizonema sp. NSF051]
NSSILSTGSVSSSGNSSILSTGSVSSSGNSSILSTGSIPSSGNSSILSTAATSTTDIANILESKTKSTAGASVSKDITSKVQETTSNSIGTLLGSAADSQTTAFANPIQALSNPTIPTILATSEAKAEVKIGPNGVDVYANASSGVQVGDLLKLNTCSNAHVTVGSSDASRLASCSHQVKARKVPEPTTIFGLTLLGAFLIFSRRKSFSLTSPHP